MPIFDNFAESNNFANKTQPEKTAMPKYQTFTNFD